MWSGGVVLIAGVHLVRYWRRVPPRAGSRSRHRGRSCRAPHWTRAYISDARARHCASPLTQEASPSPFRRPRCEPWVDHGFGRAVRRPWLDGVFPCLPTIGHALPTVTAVFASRRVSVWQRIRPAHFACVSRCAGTYCSCASTSAGTTAPEIAIAQDFMARPRRCLSPPSILRAGRDTVGRAPSVLQSVAVPAAVIPHVRAARAQ